MSRYQYISDRELKVDLFPIPYKELGAFFLIFIRVAGILVMVPFFNARVIPVLSKTGVAFVVALVLLPVISIGNVEFPDTVFGITKVIFVEAIIGMIIGLLVNVFFEGVRLMGQLVGFQTGFAIANVLDPHSGGQISILSNMAYLLAIVLFLIFNGHHILLSAMEESFEIIQVGSLRVDGQIVRKILQEVANMFGLSIRIGAPAVASLLFTQVAFGLITRLIPQMNIMIVAFPVQIVIGLFFFGLSLTVMMGVIEKYVGELNQLLITTMSYLKV